MIYSLSINYAVICGVFKKNPQKTVPDFYLTLKDDSNIL